MKKTEQFEASAVFTFARNRNPYKVAIESST